MRAKTFEFKLNGMRGIPGMLAVGLIAIVVLGLIALVVMVGAAVAVAGLAISAGAALYYTLRRKLTGGVTRFEPPEVTTASTSFTEVREIEVEVLPGKER